MLEQLELGLKPRRTFEIDASFFKDFEEERNERPGR